MKQIASRNGLRYATLLAPQQLDCFGIFYGEHQGMIACLKPDAALQLPVGAVAIICIDNHRLMEP